MDIKATKDNTLLYIEVKGYPSNVYQRGPKMGQPKITKPETQAKHWYADALLSALKLQTDFPKEQVVIALPKFEVYRKNIIKTPQLLDVLKIGVYIVDESGNVQVITNLDKYLSNNWR